VIEAERRDGTSADKFIFQCNKHEVVGKARFFPSWNDLRNEILIPVKQKRRATNAALFMG
jgi:hypothetical protein